MSLFTGLACKSPLQSLQFCTDFTRGQLRGPRRPAGHAPPYTLRERGHPRRHVGTSPLSLKRIRGNRELTGADRRAAKAMRADSANRSGERQIGPGVTPC
jgi:hypothetical protein